VFKLIESHIKVLRSKLRRSLIYAILHLFMLLLTEILCFHIRIITEHAGKFVIVLLFTTICLLSQFQLLVDMVLMCTSFRKWNRCTTLFLWKINTGTRLGSLKNRDNKPCS
jgi:hypothetical protein